MKCARCQHQNEDGAKFCEECAASLVRACVNCGHQLSPAAKFCPSCAHPTGLAPAAPAGGRFASPEAYTPRHLAARILTSRATLEGERKQVTVLFADLKGSMELLADRDPEEARKLLDPVLELMMEAVHRYEGTVNQVMGDGIMALFGAPLALEDHAVRGCYAALRLQESVRRYAEQVHRTEGVPIQVRVGLNSGQVVVRSIGSDLRMDYTAVGQTTHLAARMEQMAVPGSILISPETLNLAEGYVTVKPLGSRPVKGLDAPVEVYEVTGVSSVRSRLQATAARGLTTFVGRAAELEQLGRILDRAGSGQGQIVGVVGEPGVGKSRLCYEFTRSHRTRGWLVLESGSVSYGKATTYLPVIDLLKAYFRIADQDEHRDVREKVVGKLLTLDRALEPAIPALSGLLDVPVEDARWADLDPGQRRQRTLDAVKGLLLREARVQPLLLVFEDLHWIDSETQALLDSLAESLPTARLLLLVNYRPEYRHAWTGKTYYTQIRIDPLPPTGATALLDALLGTDPALGPLKQLLSERTDGNPFFLEESVRTLVEAGALAGERGAYRLTRPLDRIEVPATVQAVLAARIDRLPADEKALLQTAAVIGKDVPFALLQAIAPTAEEDLCRGLGHLQAAEFLYETRLFPDLEYTFKHALTHDVAYDSLLKERRRALHGRIVEAIEHLYADRLGEHAERLGHHALRGEQWERAAAYFGQAAAKAVAVGASREAVRCTQLALDALPQLPERRETVERAIDLRFGVQSALLSLGELERMRETLGEAEALAGRLRDQRRLGRVTAHMARCLWWAGELERAAEEGQRALAIASTEGDREVEIMASYNLGLTFLFAGEHRRAVEVFRPTAERLTGGQVLERFGLPWLPSVACRAFMAWCLGELGEFQAAHAAGAEGVRIAEAAGQPYSLVIGYWAGTGAVQLRQGNVGTARARFERALELCRGENFAYLFGWVATSLGQTYVYSGRVEEGLALLEQAAAQSEALRLAVRYPWALTWLAEARLAAGDRRRALEDVGRAIGLARANREQWVLADALRVLGDARAAGESLDVEGAAAAYLDASVLATGLSMLPLVAHCHLGLGTLYRRVGSREQAREHLTTAASLYREMDMRRWLERAELETTEPA
jgi:class 3 adenylate cyclase/tetratricopeptide (TPR) repeat protein